MLNSKLNNTKVAVGAIFKNESHIIEEWIKHYLKEGVDLFVLIDNGSSDNYQQTIEKYRNWCILYKDERRYMQNQHYNTYITRHLNGIDWLIIVDLDEFVYSRGLYRTIKEYLVTLPESVTQIRVLWKIFGSSFYIFQPPEVIPYFLYRKTTEEVGNWYKSIMRVKYLKSIGLHYSYMTKGITAYTCIKHRPDCKNRSLYCFPSEGCMNYTDCKEINFKTIDINQHNLHLNHYNIQSWEYFKNVKMTRGDCFSSALNSIRNENYFKNNDKNIVLDEELKNKIYN